MFYLSEHGDIEQGLERQARLNGDPPIEAIANKPRLRATEHQYLQAFGDLDTERVHGMMLARIPRSKALAYARECGMNEDAMYEFYDIIRAIDDAHLEALSAKIKRSSK